MKNILNHNHWFFVCYLLLSLGACKKSDQFYNQLKSLPQIDLRTGFAYNPAYITGDTMVITGLMKPINTLQINIGSVKANIVSVDSAKYKYPGGGGVNGFDSTYVDRVKIVITQAMEGKKQEVKLINNGNSALGPSIDVYPYGGKGSFNDSLKLVPVKTFPGTGNVFLHANNGKGDIYYYAPGTHDLRHIKKDGSEDVLLSMSNLTDQFGPYTINTCVTGGVNPQGTTAYLSVITDNGGYRFLKINIQSKTLSTLNSSVAIAAPFEGKIDQVKIVINGIYPDSKGNVYLAVSNNSAGKTPNAVALYAENTGQLSYIFKVVDYALFAPISGMPGVEIKLPAVDQHIQGVRFSPDENLLYALTFANITTQGGINVYDLSARMKLDQFQPSTPPVAGGGLNILGPFSSLRVAWNYEADRNFGLLPMPGRRLQTLQYQFYGPYGGDLAATAKSGFPKWTVVDFSEQRIYAYATGRCNVGNYTFGPYDRFQGPSVSVTDQLLNYDEDGNLYMTANGKSVLVKTQVIK